MNPLQFKISRKARTDIDEIWLYTVSKWSVSQANHYYNLIFNEINYICTAPESGKNMGHIRNGYRVSKMKSHLIFYRVVDDIVEVIRILHQRMDIEGQLKA